MYINVYIHIHIHTYTYVHLPLRDEWLVARVGLEQRCKGNTSTYIYMGAYIYTYIYTHTHTHTHTYIYIYICMYICICIYIYIYIYIYTHTHTHTHTAPRAQAVAIRRDRRAALPKLEGLIRGEAWPLQDSVLCRGFCTRTNTIDWGQPLRLGTPITAPHRPYYCAIYYIPRPPFCSIPYNIGNANTV